MNKQTRKRCKTCKTWQGPRPCNARELKGQPTREEKGIKGDLRREGRRELEGVRGGRRGEYSCRCHGKRVISAPSKPLKLKLAGHIL